MTFKGSQVRALYRPPYIILGDIMPRVSVLMPVYNTNEEFLKEAIQSILNQTFGDFEFIILDDGSKNDVESVIKSFNDDRIKFYKNEKNMGIPYTRNRLLDLANSEYLAYMDSDDTSYPNRLEIQVNFLDNNQDVAVVGAGLKISNDEIYINKYDLKYLDVVQRCCVHNNVVMIRKSILDKYNIRYNENYPSAEDYHLWSNIIKYSRIVNLPDILIDYRIHTTNTTVSKKILTQECDFKVKEEMLDFLTDDDKLKQKLRRILFDNKKVSFLQNIFSIQNSDHYKYKIVRIFGFKFYFIKKEYK
ncbi:MAG: glycosyltransferase family 2 protein [Cyanobacteria bacterium SIG30]|nr:glycosyltransferase family 2 protein [Cyanobacteria bacterium SIG30]